MKNIIQGGKNIFLFKFYIKLEIKRKRALLRRMKSIYYGTFDVEDGMVDAWLGIGYIDIA